MKVVQLLLLLALTLKATQVANNNQTTTPKPPQKNEESEHPVPELESNNRRITDIANVVRYKDISGDPDLNITDIMTVDRYKNLMVMGLPNDPPEPEPGSLSVF